MFATHPHDIVPTRIWIDATQECLDRREKSGEESQEACREAFTTMIECVAQHPAAYKRLIDELQGGKAEDDAVPAPAPAPGAPAPAPAPISAPASEPGSASPTATNVGTRSGEGSAGPGKTSARSLGVAGGGEALLKR